MTGIINLWDGGRGSEDMTECGGPAAKLKGYDSERTGAIDDPISVGGKLTVLARQEEGLGGGTKIAGVHSEAR